MVKNNRQVPVLYSRWFITHCPAAAADHSGNTNTCTFTVMVVESPILLSISQQGANVILSWPVTCSIYQLQETLSLSPPITWTPTVLPVVSNFQNLVTVPHGRTNRFFRLQSP